MKAALIALLRAAFPPAEPVIAPQPRTAGGKRKLNGKRKRPMPKGAVRGDINGNLIEQARQAGGVKQ
ncbi:hypothetical protein [Burkholderia sp. BE17]|uniref:hypothetical protein n=1 Tax=Burkholderia sp. BE17 TaxID=2656644 RepID=UPI00128BB355|nr:hypothetical protein [Burkholderia sp. BE17]MPV66398.1 hypothetical protein [Burkholderia sp. BE17]